MSESIETKSGFVGFFDILGYQKIMENDDIELVAKNISSVFKGIKEDVRKPLLDIFDKDEIKPMIIAILDAFEWSIFSDTIVVILPVEDVADKNMDQKKFNDANIQAKVMMFLFAGAILIRKMLDKGFPLRGSISYGKYFIDQNCLVGKPIIEAYKLTVNQDWSGCVLDEQAKIRFLKCIQYTPRDWKKYMDGILFPYAVPLKGDIESLHYCINWVNPPLIVEEALKLEGAHGYISSSFCAHKKMVTKSVYQKIENTYTFSVYTLKNIVG